MKLISVKEAERLPTQDRKTLSPGFVEREGTGYVRGKSSLCHPRWKDQNWKGFFFFLQDCGELKTTESSVSITIFLKIYLQANATQGVRNTEGEREIHPFSLTNGYNRYRGPPSSGSL